MAEPQALLKSYTYRCPLHGSFSYAAKPGEKVPCYGHPACTAKLEVMKRK